MTDLPRSRELLARARALMPGGVSSPVRAFGAVGGTPPFVVGGDGPFVHDEDGNAYVDCVLAYGPLILGHGHPAVVAALSEQLGRGTAFGSPGRSELALAERVVAAVPGIEMVRFVNSGTEATMSALRVARAATRRDLVVKFAGGYHGHSDLLLTEAGSGMATLGIPASPGVPGAVAALTATLPYNDLEGAQAFFTERGEEIAAVIVEPIAGNMGCVPPVEGFLEGLRRLCTGAGALLVFDEVMTGFRVAYGGAQSLLGVRPDLTCLGKVIGGGLPVGAYGGSAELMGLVAPSGPVYQAGTLSGNPLAMAAGCATLDVLAGGDAYVRLEGLGDRLAAGLRAGAEAAGVPCAVQRAGSMVTPFLGVDGVRDYDDARRADRALFARVHARWLDAGVLWPPSQFEAGFLSTAHGDAEIDRIAGVFADALR
ncbi:MAG TPA: glutamate-1-semialdehyde 2,1-aminomutase [Candidatus Dormibacteraeota bacterium]|nr:glutamate-1-semialdehyde 2,1-aminomutase [Candidatus Dormibacteraeota bacterium]